jgi:hypothetical protein
MAETLQAAPAVEPGQVLSVGPVLNLELALDAVGPPETARLEEGRVAPFGADLMMRAFVVPGVVDPMASNRTPIEKKTTISTVRNNQTDTSSDIDYSYDTSDPSR